MSLITIPMQSDNVKSQPIWTQKRCENTCKYDKLTFKEFLPQSEENSKQYGGIYDEDICVCLNSKNQTIRLIGG